MLNFLKIRLSLISLLFLGFPYFAKAQLDNRLLEEQLRMPQSTSEKTLWMKFQNYNFLRNNEYFNPIVSGETLLGSQLGGSLVYQPNKYVRLEAGVFLSQNFGQGELNQVQPIFRFIYQKDSSKIIFGNLHANYAHRLIEPLYGFEQGITQRLERGLQLIRHRPRLYSELWIDWQQVVSMDRDTPEIFWVGLVNEWTVLQKNKFSISLPLQVTVRHTGGQDLIVPTLLGNELNAALGLKIQQDFKQPGFMKKIYAEVYGLYSSEKYGGPSEIDRTGNGLYYNLGIDTKPIHILLSLWQGEGFNSTQGGDLYKSFSQKEDGVFQNKRDLLFVRLLKNWSIQKNLSLSLRAEPYYDFQNELIELNFGLYVTYHPLFKLWSGTQQTP